jgi:hypothetical protein
VIRGRAVWLLAVVGAALVGVGAYQAVATSGGSGATAAIIAGSLLR